MTDKERFQKLWRENGKSFAGIELSYLIDTGQISSVKIVFANGLSITLHPMGNIIKLEVPKND